MTTVEFEAAVYDSPESYRKFVQKQQETEPMPTMNDIYQLAVTTNERVDSLGDKITALEDEVRAAVKTLMDAFTQGKAT